MRTTDLELERLRHLATRNHAIDLESRLVQRETADLLASIRARLSIEGHFEVLADGSVRVSPATPDNVHPIKSNAS